MSMKIDSKEEKIEKILDLMRSGASCLKSCQKVGVANSTFMDWLAADKVIAEKYATARREMIDKIADDLMDICDAPVGITDNGGTDSGAVQDKRLRVDTRKWLLSKLAPKKYGDKVEISGDADNPISITTIKRIVVRNSENNIDD